MNKDKFNCDYDKLLSSYNELEKQFTKKCQELARLSGASGTSEQTPPQQMGEEEFFQRYPEAEKYRDEILQMSSTPEQSGKSDALFYGYVEALNKNLSPEKVVNSPDFVQQYVLPNASLTAKILQEAMGNGENAPTVITGNGGAMSLALPNKPKTIEEASQLAKELFNK